MILDNIWGSRMTLLVVDMQRKFLPDGNDSCNTVDLVVARINALAQVFRSHGRPVIFIATDGDGHGLYTKTDGDEWIEGLVRLPGDRVVHKSGMSAFRGTELESVLKENGTDCVLIAGMFTELCIAGTYYSASERDMFPCVAQGAVIGYSKGINDAAEMMMNTVTVETVKRFLDGKQEYLNPGMC